MDTYTSDLFKRLVLLLVILVAGVIALYQFTPRDVVPVSAPPSEFFGVSQGATVNSTNPIVVSVADLWQGLPSIPGMTITPRSPDTMPEPVEIKAITLHYLTDVNCYLVKTGDSYILIDTGFSTTQTDFEKELESVWIQSLRIWIRR